MAVVSAAFKSSLSLPAYVQFSCYLDMQNASRFPVSNNKLVLSIAYGLGTYRRLKEDITTNPVLIGRNPRSDFIEASVADARQLLKNFQVNQNVINNVTTEEQVRRYQMTVELDNVSCLFQVQEIGQKNENNVLVFLHGFLGTGDDWIAIMKAISGSARCISVDLPGHGKSVINTVKIGEQEPCLSLEMIAGLLHNLIHHITPEKVTLVGYSMGARIALYMALKFGYTVKGAVVISGSPGLNDKLARKIRSAKDDSRACSMVAHGLKLFLESWYAGELWRSFRSHPHFNRIIASRLQQHDVQGLAKILSGLSIGRQHSLWEDLKNCRTPLVLMYGEKDTKFKKIAEAMVNTMFSGQKKCNKVHEVVEILNCGHAVHLENPLSVISALRHFLTSL